MTSKTLTAGKTYFVTIKEETRHAGFFDEACQNFYLCRLLHCLNAYQVKLHAYLLEPNQILLLITPMNPAGFYSLMGFLNQNYSNYFASRFDRPVRVWRNAAFICLLPSHKLALDCQKFIERFPLKNRLYRHPGEYRFSSYCSNSFARNPGYLSKHPAFSLFLNREPESLSRYREFVARPFSEPYRQYLESRLMYGRCLMKLKAQIQLEKIKALTDKQKNATRTVVTGKAGNMPGLTPSYNT